MNRKNAEIAKVKAANTRTDVNNLLQGAKTLDTAMHGLEKALKINLILKIVVNI